VGAIVYGIDIHPSANAVGKLNCPGNVIDGAHGIGGIT
jgi:hypothetical protein